MNAELEMLRSFYAAWVGLHTIPRAPGNRRKQEAAAQLLVDRAHELRTFYQAEHAEKPVIEVIEAANE